MYQYYVREETWPIKSINVYNYYVVDEIELDPGDLVGIFTNHWDGYSEGTNDQTGVTGFYPGYKTVDKKVIVKYPTYPEVPLTVPEK